MSASQDQPDEPRELAGPDEDDEALPPAGHALRSRVFVLAALVLVVSAALAAGAGAFRGGSRHLSLYQRTMAVAGEYRCPVCAGESAADSSAPAALEIRALVREWLQEGKSQAQIRANLVGDYGESILLEPPASGLDVLVWVLPALAVALGAVGLGWAFVRWKRLVPAPLGAAPAGEPSPNDMAFQGVARDEGLPSEGEALHGVTNGAAALQGTLFELAPDLERAPRPEPAPRPRRPWYWRLMLPAGVALLMLGAALWLVDRTSSELPGGTITGSLTGLNVELSEAQALTAKDPAKALEIYSEVLASDPDQPIALTAEGWIFAEAGLASRAMPLLTKAEKVDPSYGAAHLYRGLVLLQDYHDPSGAVAELTWYLGHDPSSSLVKVAREALADARSGQKSATQQKSAGQPKG